MSADQQPACTPVPRRKRIFLTAVSVLLAMSAVYAFVAFPVYGHRAQQYFEISEARLGFVLSSLLIGSLFSLLLVGPATDRFGPRRMLQGTLAGVGLAYLLCGFGRSLWALQLGLALSGFFGAAKAVSLPTFLICLYPALRRRMVTISLVSLAIPGVVFPLVAQWLLESVEAGAMDFATALHGPFIVLAVALLAGQFLLGFSGDAGEEIVDDEDRQQFRLREVLTAPALVVIACAALHSGADNALYSWLPKFMESSFATLPIGTGLMLGLYSAAYAVARVSLAALPEHVGQRIFLALPGPIGGGAMIAALWLGGPLAISLVYVLMGLLVATEYPALLAEIREGSAARFSAVYGASIWVGNLLAIVNTNAIGFIGQRTGDLRIGLTLGAVGFIVFGLIAWVTKMGLPESITGGAHGPGHEQAAE